MDKLMNRQFENMKEKDHRPADDCYFFQSGSYESTPVQLCIRSRYREKIKRNLHPLPVSLDQFEVSARLAPPIRELSTQKEDPHLRKLLRAFAVVQVRVVPHRFAGFRCPDAV